MAQRKCRKSANAPQIAGSPAAQEGYDRQPTQATGREGTDGMGPRGSDIATPRQVRHASDQAKEMQTPTEPDHPDPLHPFPTTRNPA